MHYGWMLIIACACSVLLLCCTGSKPSGLGVSDGKLSPCPDSPNCVSSRSSDEKHFIPPLRYTGSLAEARERLIRTINSMKRTNITRAEDRYLHAEFTSAVFRFVDDVEFLFDDSEKVIHVRSASRIGYSDFGVNRKRVETIRTRYQALAETGE